MPSFFASGNDGRLRLGVGNIVIGGITAWKVTKTITLIDIPHFETPADGDGTLWPIHIKGLAGATGSLEGYYDMDSVLATETGSGISVGIQLLADLIMVKATPFGFSNVVITIMSFDVGTNIENQPTKFTAQFKVYGVMPKATLVT